ncbi:substrate-binding periplasmic protein [Leucobacter luti]|uniref:Amino acid ABC transporter substrate-binding protein (PAAT family) n=1 Tax=Leucobacter luti TaxID=340320 RepID=A0A4Q7U438_9MICO|nr:transporter substrate-binding domain-containing protein [Leucobacter luti]MBL3700714.1 hypothetical protein [Leucobacter luti]RZT68445.1 amino acid ABC transporter substrate-binding protein (PAAT family) [Leucobacter luti]
MRSLTGFRITAQRSGVAIAGTAAALLLLTSCAGSGEPAQEAGAAVAEDCTPLHEFTTIEPGVLTVAAMNAAPKFHALSDSGPFTGIDATLIPEFAAENCLEVKFKPMTGAAAQLDLREGKSDMFGGLILKTPERAEVFAQTEGSILYETLGITSAKDAAYDTVDSLQGKRVGTLSGSYYVEPLKAAYGANNVEEYQSDANAFEDLKAGRIDAVAWQSIQGFNFTDRDDDYVTKILDDDQKYPELTVLLENNWPHTKGNSAMTAAIDDYYERAKADGTVARVLEENEIGEEAAELYVNGR